jgi:uncharacterized protein YbaP (TraB family)
MKLALNEPIGLLGSDIQIIFNENQSMKHSINNYLLFISVNVCISIMNLVYAQYPVQTSVAVFEESHGAKDTPSGLIYKIENVDNSQQMLLIGSTHFGYEKMQGFDKVLENKMKDFCEKFADESSTEDYLSEFDQKLQTQLALTGAVLSDTAIEEVYVIFKRKFGTALALFNADSNSKIKLLPISTVVTMLLASIDVIGMPVPKGMSLDQIFKNHATSKGQKIEPLEMRASTLKHFGAVKNSEYLLLAEELIKLSKNKAKQTIMGQHGTSALNYLAQGNANLVRQEFINSYAVSTNIGQELLQKFFFDRDIHITDQIEALMKSEKNYCVAVGAAHLGGETGILKRLVDKKYLITRITN